ncbi:MAG: DUF2249 domain-containing protein [Lysobacteraceae bacterium]
MDSLDASTVDAPGANLPAPNTARPRMLDLRGLPAPEPLLRALAAAEALVPGECLVVLTPLMPMPLLQMLQADGLCADACVLGDGSARVHVRRD